MSENQNKQLEQHLLDIVNILRDRISMKRFKNYTLRTALYEHLAEKMLIYANQVLEDEGILYQNLAEGTIHGEAYMRVVKKDSLKNLGYFLKPTELFGKENPELTNTIKEFVNNMNENL